MANTEKQVIAAANTVTTQGETKMKTIIKATSKNRVYIKYESGVTGEVYEMNIYAPVNGGYVRYGKDGKQLCDKLASMGDTLYWAGKEPLIDLIRREYYAMCRAEKRETNRYR